MQKKLKKFISYVIFPVFIAVLNVSCTPGDSDYGISKEYVNDDVSYKHGESCRETYIFYEESGKYTRFISGQYCGEILPGTYYGTRFETGTFIIDETKATGNIEFRPERQYNFDTKKLEKLGLFDDPERAPYTGTLTEETLTINWEVRVALYGSYEIPVTYKRQ